MEKTICFFSIYQNQFPRDRVLLRALEKAGYKMISCIDTSPAFKKYRNIVQKHATLKGGYDIALVGYTGHILVPLVKFISRKKIIFNASNSIFEAVILDREKKSMISLLALKSWLLDFIAFHCSDIVLVETDAQADFLAKTFWVKRGKFVRVWTSANEDEFFPDTTIKKESDFTVLFRGAFLPFVGVECVIDAARILTGTGIKFLVIGNGVLQQKIVDDISKHPVVNLTLITEHLPLEELRARMLSCHAAIAQVSCHPRVGRTITNKTFEYLALGMPFLTADAQSNKELLTDGVDCIFVPCGDPQTLAQRIIELRDNPDLRETLERNARALFEREMTVNAIARTVSSVFDGLIKRV